MKAISKIRIHQVWTDPSEMTDFTFKLNSRLTKIAMDHAADFFTHGIFEGNFDVNVDGVQYYCIWNVCTSTSYKK